MMEEPQPSSSKGFQNVPKKPLTKRKENSEQVLPNRVENNNLEELDCPFKNDDPNNICRLIGKQRSDKQDFRKHLFLHYRNSTREWITSYWDERLKNVKRGEQLSMYCDLCSTRKVIKAPTQNGLRNSMICHLALFHNELRDIMDKDEKLSKDFIKSVFHDVDFKKIWKNVVKEVIKLRKPNEIEPFVKDNDLDDIPDLSSDEPDLWPKNPAGSTSKKNSVIKSKPRPRKSSPDPVLKENKEVVRKRRPINFTLEDLDLDNDEAEDENWTGSPNSVVTKTATAKRASSRRKSRNSVKKYTPEDESD